MFKVALIRMSTERDVSRHRIQMKVIKGRKLYYLLKLMRIRATLKIFSSNIFSIYSSQH